MGNKIVKMLLSMPVILLCTTTCFADNPIVQTYFTADPAPMVFQDTLFLYTGHDSEIAVTSFFMRDWKCFSTTDMVNWRERATILPTRTISWSTGDANAGQCIYRNGNFYWYFPTGCTTDGNLCALGVAVATNPLGPFTDIGQPLIKGSVMTGCNATHGWRGLDPTVWIDDDGQAYMYWGNNVCYWVRLNSNMTSYSGSITCIAQNNTAAFGPDFEEAPWIYKRNGLWYMLYASSIPEKIGYTTSSSPTGPWTYKSIIVNPLSGDNGNHPGYIEYKGNSYFFTFMDKASGLPGCGQFKRAVCVERFTYNGDGTIPTIQLTRTGAPQIGHFNPYDTTQAETICWEVGVRTEPCGEGGIDVDSIHNGDYIKVKGVDFGSGAASFIARVASATSGGNIELRLDTTTGTLVGTCAVAGTGGWQTWTTRTCTVTGATGVHNLFLRFTGGSGLLFNFNWWKFNPTTGIGTPAGTMGERGNTIKVVTNAGQIKLDFSEPVSRGIVDVRLFDLTGRLAATLFKGRLSSPHLTFQLNRTEIRTGAYLIRVSMDNKILINSSLIFND
jgi:arabinoxylan arabinofuranohydrolase